MNNMSSLQLSFDFDYGISEQQACELCHICSNCTGCCKTCYLSNTCNLCQPCSQLTREHDGPRYFSVKTLIKKGIKVHEK